MKTKNIRNIVVQWTPDRAPCSVLTGCSWCRVGTFSPPLHLFLLGLRFPPVNSTFIWISCKRIKKDLTGTRRNKLPACSWIRTGDWGWLNCSARSCHCPDGPNVYRLKWSGRMLRGRVIRNGLWGVGLVCDAHTLWINKWKGIVSLALLKFPRIRSNATPSLWVEHLLIKPLLWPLIRNPSFLCLSHLSCIKMLKNEI